MIGFYDYTVILTYLSLLSGSLGIIVCLSGMGHPFLGMLFLMACGLCDTFDGKVARTKKDRTPQQKAFGIQIDSLADLVSFGVLPPCVGVAMLRISEKLSDVPKIKVADPTDKMVLHPIFLISIGLFYVMAAMIRLAYFNVLEEERSKVENTVRKYYVGLPVTSSALIFPSVMLIQYATDVDMSLLYFGVMLITAFLFILRIQVPKPKNKGIFILVAIGLAEFIALLAIRHYLKWR